MTITTNWKIDSIECLTQVGELTDVVYTLHWRLYATDGTMETSIYGSCVVELDPEANFIPYEELDEATAVSWVHGKMGAEEVTRAENSVTAALENLLSPKVVITPLPWA